MKSFRCPVCSRKYATFPALKDHHKHKHPDADKSALMRGGKDDDGSVSIADDIVLGMVYKGNYRA